MSGTTAPTGEDTASETATSRPRWRRITGSFWFQLLLAFAVVGLVLTFIAKPYAVPSASMTDTLQVGDRVLVNRLAYVGAEPGTGDVIVFDAGDAWDTAPAEEEPLPKAIARWVGEVTGFGPSGRHTLVKRVIGLPGQSVECCSATGQITVDGEPLDEPYVSRDHEFIPGTLDCDSAQISTRCFAAVTVPDDRYLVLGDNRANSSDSAAQCRGGIDDESCWRWAERSEIVGKVGVILWPLSRWSLVD